jgi:hypothetical protein
LQSSITKQSIARVCIIVHPKHFSCSVLPFVKTTKRKKEEKNESKAANFEVGTRVTRLGEFSPNLHLFTLDSFFNYRGSPKYWILNYAKNRIGLHFGPFLHKLIWSPWLCLPSSKCECKRFVLENIRDPSFYISVTSGLNPTTFKFKTMYNGSVVVG